jgi:hypothetical protein
MKTIKLFFRVVLAVGVVGLSACASATPASRVAAAPQKFEGLTSGQKEAVLQGQVQEGMSPDAVYLALGQPDRVTRGSANGQPYETWTYTELKPVYRSSVTMGMGGGFGYPYHYGRRGRYHSPYLGAETGPDYVPVTSAVIRFSRNRVTGWEKLR